MLFIKFIGRDTLWIFQLMVATSCRIKCMAAVMDSILPAIPIIVSDSSSITTATRSISAGDDDGLEYEPWQQVATEEGGAAHRAAT